MMVFLHIINNKFNIIYCNKDKGTTDRQTDGKETGCVK